MRAPARQLPCQPLSGGPRTSCLTVPALSSNRKLRGCLIAPDDTSTTKRSFHNCRAASERSSASSAASKLRRLKQKLKRSVEVEDYGEAAVLRDAIREIEDGDPVLRLKAELEDAIQAQNFEEAIRCRDKLKELAPPPKPRIPIAAPPPTSSDSVTNGVRIQVKSSFLPHRSNPGSYVFMYRIRICNETKDRVVRLHSRHWIITDANYHQDIVRGLGVVGEQPELKPGEEHTYGSFCPIRTPTGKMKGSFRMQVLSGNDWVDEFDADIGVFGLDMSDATPASW